MFMIENRFKGVCLRAVHALAPGVIGLADVPEPADVGEVMVKVLLAGICGSDLRILAGKNPLAYPRILGHEMVGEIVSAPQNSRLAQGSRVLVDPAVSCGWCDLCIDGRPNLCLNGGLMGRDVDGVFTEYLSVPDIAWSPIAKASTTKRLGASNFCQTAWHLLNQATG